MAAKKRYVYVSTKYYHDLHLSGFPSTGRYGNITGMRNLYWGQEAFIVRCGPFAYKVDEATFDKAVSLIKTFKF